MFSSKRPFRHLNVSIRKLVKFPPTRLQRGYHRTGPTAETSGRHVTMQNLGNKVEGCTSEEDLFSYKAQRWLWNESEQLQRRYLRFNLKALIKVAEDAAGPGASCVEVSKLPEGNFNKTFLLTMLNGSQLIARLPNPNAGQSHHTTASEVATMDYVRDRLHLPVPKVLAYSTRTTSNGVGAEYIIMEKCPGIELGRLWDDISARQRIEIVRQLTTYLARLSHAHFPGYGALYYGHDIPNMNGIKVDDVFSVGPTISRVWFDDRRAEVDVCRGPWLSAHDVVDSIVKRERLCVETFSQPPRDRQQGIFNGPDGFQPTKSSKMTVLQEVSNVFPHIMPTDDTFVASTLWHNDLHSDNIFVDKDRPTEITGIIDWQGVHLSPAFLHVHYPSLIEYEGPILNDFELPKLPENFSELDSDAKNAARALHTAQSIRGLFHIFSQRECPDLLRVLRNRDTLASQIIILAGSTFDDGEAYVQSLLAKLSEPEIWAQVVQAKGQADHTAPCPLIYSNEELARQKDDLAKWERDIERKARVIREVGAYTGWDGAVPPEEYNVMSKRLETAKKRFLDEESKSPEDREQWTRVWPFQDD